MTVDTKTATRNLKDMLVAQAGDATNTKKEDSQNEGAVLKRRLSDIGIIIGQEITQPEDIMNHLTEENKTLQDPIRQ